MHTYIYDMYIVVKSILYYMMYMSKPAVRYIWCVCVFTVILAVVAGVCCAFLLGLLCGVGAVIVYTKCSRKTHPPPSQSPPPAPLYDDIELSTTTKHEVELEHTVAYAHLN